MENSRPILLVEDESHDVFFLQMALEKAEVQNALAVVSDGRQAIDYLGGTGKFADRRQNPLPCLVLLDLRLPIVPGMEVLRWARKQAALAHIPILIHSSSNQDSDVEDSYRLGANGYIVKPIRPADLLEIVLRIKKYWLEMKAPPPGCADWFSVTIPPPGLGEVAGK